MTDYYYDVIAGTSLTECIKFVRLYPFSFVFSLVVLCALITGDVFLHIRHPNTRGGVFYCRIALLISMALFIGLTVFSLVKFKDFQALYYRPVALRNFVSYLKKRDIAELRRNPKIPSGIHSDNSEILGVVIVGESASREFMGCYGYSRDTTPEMSKRNWILYKDVMTSIPVTSTSIRYMFTDSTVAGAPVTTSLPVLFSRLPNCSIDCISMQYKEAFGAVDIILGNCSKYTHLLPGKDGDYQLVEYLMRAPEFFRIQGKKLLVLHLNGSHVPFDEQYPNDFHPFGNKTEQDKYDNSIAYTDYVVESLMRIIEKWQGAVWVLYVSDHGESPGKGIRKFKYHSTWEIPFAFWFNEEFRKQHSDLTEAVLAHVNEPIQSDCVFEIVCRLMGVDWCGFHNERIPFDKAFTPQPRHLINIKEKGKTGH